MARRIAVPAVARISPERVIARLSVLLQPREAAAVYDRKLQPLEGIRWPRGSTRVALPGEVAMFDIDDPGELQRW